MGRSNGHFHHVDPTKVNVSSLLYWWRWLRSEMTLNYQVIGERYPFPNGVVGGLIPAVTSSLNLTKKTIQVGRKPRTYHRKVGSKPHHASRRFLQQVRPTCSNSRWIVRRWLFISLASIACQMTKIDWIRRWNLYIQHEYKPYENINGTILDNS